MTSQVEQWVTELQDLRKRRKHINMALQAIENNADLRMKTLHRRDFVEVLVDIPFRLFNTPFTMFESTAEHWTTFPPDITEEFYLFLKDQRQQCNGLIVDLEEKLNKLA